MARDPDDDAAAHGLSPREWLEADAVPLTPDVDFSDPEQRSAWMKANNEENHARWLELQARRGRDRAGDRDGVAPRAPLVSTTTVVPVRFLNAEQRALVRLARQRGVSVSDLVRRWVRAGLDEAHGLELVDDTQERARRTALGDAADAIVERIADEVRRLREVVVARG